jgi:hypothetical protein
MLPCRVDHKFPERGLGPLTFLITDATLHLLMTEFPHTYYNRQVRTNLHRSRLGDILEEYGMNLHNRYKAGFRPMEPILREPDLCSRMFIALQVSILECLRKRLGSKAAGLIPEWSFTRYKDSEEVRVHIAYSPNPSIVETVIASKSEQDWHSKVDLHAALLHHTDQLKTCIVKLYWAKVDGETGWAVYSYIQCPDPAPVF